MPRMELALRGGRIDRGGAIAIDYFAIACFESEGLAGP